MLATRFKQTGLEGGEGGELDPAIIRPYKLAFNDILSVSDNDIDQKCKDLQTDDCN
jgi:hypothetical protein